jgi:hypothetical protein
MAKGPVKRGGLFGDWRRFCFVLREIASGVNGYPLSGLEAQKRAQTVLSECGYAWPRQTVAPDPIAAPICHLKLKTN